MANGATWGQAFLMLTVLISITSIYAKGGGDPLTPIDPKFPSIRYLDETKTRELQMDFTAVRSNWLLVGNDKWFLPEAYLAQGPVYFSYQTHYNDTWLVNFPKSGTHWIQEAIWLLSNELNYKAAETQELQKRFPYFESTLTSNQNQSEVSDQLLSRPKYLRTHLPFSLVPSILKSGSKAVYVARNPKDVAVSYYKYFKNSTDFEFVGTFEKFWSYFQSDETVFSPYWSHLKEGWSQRENNRVLFLFSEEITYDPAGALKKIASFLGKSYTDQQYSELVDFLAYHYKFGTETWHGYFTPKLNDKANQWFINNLENTDIVFPYINIFD